MLSFCFAFCLSKNTFVERQIAAENAQNQKSFFLQKNFPFGKVCKNLSLPSATLGGDVYAFDFKCEGVIVKEFEDVRTLEGYAGPMKNSGIKTGNIITKVNGESLAGAADFASKIEKSDGAVNLEYLDGNKVKNANVFPVANLSGTKKLGVWVKDDVSATGTLSFTDNSTGVFYALGHGIFDFETGAKVKTSEGIVRKCKVIGTNKSFPGSVGEIKTVFEFEKAGEASLNGNFGAVGKLNETQAGKIMPLATSGEIKIGKAKIYCTIDSTGAKEYECEIIKISQNRENQNLTIRITDRSLIDKTGGIVQGMSGSAIIQNDKIVGVLTHSFVNNPKLGFAVLPEKII